MLSPVQIFEKKARVKKVVETFLMYDNISINQLEKIIKVPSSTIQRDLNDIEFIHMIYVDRSKDILKKINEKLKRNLKRGTSIGGINSTTNNEPIRDENGRFIGNKKR